MDKALAAAVLACAAVALVAGCQGGAQAPAENQTPAAEAQIQPSTTQTLQASGEALTSSPTTLPGQPPGPPIRSQLADACAGKAPNDPCELSARRATSGVCKPGRGTLVCRPQPNSPSGARQDEPPGPMSTNLPTPPGPLDYPEPG